MGKIEIERTSTPKIEPIYFGPNYGREIGVPKEGEPPVRGLAVLIAGAPGTGTTTFAKELGRAWGLPAGTKKRLGAGDILRAETKEPILGFAEREVKVDRRLDRRTARSISRTLPGHGKIIEARLAGVLGVEGGKRAQEFGILSFPDLFIILLWAPEEVRVERGFQRDNEKYPQLNLTKDIYRKLQRERYLGDLEQFRKAHPGVLDNFDPLDPSDEWSRLHYDLIINSAELRPDEIVDLTQETLREKKVEVAKGNLGYLDSRSAGVYRISEGEGI